jgi:hypothetical protein
MGDTPRVMNQTRGALWGGKCGDRGRTGFDDEDCALLLMTNREVLIFASRFSTLCCLMVLLSRATPFCGDGK